MLTLNVLLSISLFCGCSVKVLDTKKSCTGSVVLYEGAGDWSNLPLENGIDGGSL